MVLKRIHFKQFASVSTGFDSFTWLRTIKRVGYPSAAKKGHPFKESSNMKDPSFQESPIFLTVHARASSLLWLATYAYLLQEVHNFTDVLWKNWKIYERGVFLAVAGVTWTTRPLAPEVEAKTLAPASEKVLCEKTSDKFNVVHYLIHYRKVCTIVQHFFLLSVYLHMFPWYLLPCITLSQPVFVGTWQQLFIFRSCCVV